MGEEVVYLTVIEGMPEIDENQRSWRGEETKISRSCSLRGCRKSALAGNQEEIKRRRVMFLGKRKRKELNLPLVVGQIFAGCQEF